MSQKYLFLRKYLNVSRETKKYVLHETNKYLEYNYWMFGKKQQNEPTEKQKIGKIGEDCACEYLRKKGYRIIDRNYLKKWGELDIVAKKGKIIHFVEVKSVSHDISDDNVIRETREGYRPEDNMHPWKLKRLGRAIQSYLLDKDTYLQRLTKHGKQVPDDVDWQFDVVTVFIDMDKRLSKIFLLEDIVI